jgi:pyruvate/2-oxoglutarate/acetoin dehydrogenase E1 component
MGTVLDSVTRTRRAVVLHDAHTFCGLGAEIAAQISTKLFGELLAPVTRLGAGYSPAPYAPSWLSFHPTADDVVAAVRGTLSRP